MLQESKPNHVCKLNRALYGLKQAPRAWFDKLRATLIQWGFENSKSDTSLLIFNSNGKTIYLLVYVDDILFMGNDELLLNKLTSDLNKDFALKNLGQIHYFMVIDAYGDATGLYLTQSRVLDLNSVCGEKNENFSFSTKLMCLENVVLDSVFSFKSSNAAITKCGFEFDSIVAVLDSDI